MSRLTYLREISQYFRHFIPSLPTPNVDDDITVGVLGQGLGDDSFTTPKGSGDSCCPSLYTSIQNTKLFYFQLY